MLTTRGLLCSCSILVHLIKLLLLLCNCKDLSLLLLRDRDISAPYLGTGVGLWKSCSLQGFGLWNLWSLLGLFGVLTLQSVRGAHSCSQGVILSEVSNSTMLNLHKSIMAFSLVKLCLFSQMQNKYCHTLISSGDHCLMACNLRLTASRNLTPIVKQSVKFRDVSGVERKHYCAIREVL
ncbi:hypothetical protein HKD37_05G013277 [Glycine soja]